MNVNNIKVVPKDVCRNYNKLQELKLDDNMIDDINPDAFKSCSDLRILTLRNNRIHKITEGLVSHFYLIMKKFP